MSAGDCICHKTGQGPRLCLSFETVVAFYASVYPAPQRSLSLWQMRGFRGLGCSCNENDLSNEALLCFPYHQLPEFPLTSYEVGTPRPIFQTRTGAQRCPGTCSCHPVAEPDPGGLDVRSTAVVPICRVHAQAPVTVAQGAQAGVIECARRGDDARSGRDGGWTAQDFTTLLRMAHELDLNDCLFLEFPP